MFDEMLIVYRGLVSNSGNVQHNPQPQMGKKKAQNPPKTKQRMGDRVDMNDKYWKDNLHCTCISLVFVVPVD